jgi:cytochrome c oxidase cbb3-type subunit 2
MAGGIYKKPIMFSIVAFLVILAGTVATMFGPMMTEQMHPKLENLKPFTPLQLAGRDIYQREGCNNCHTQTVRPLKAEVMRYGEYSKAGEFAYDRPFLWGSKRTGPDLARIGGKYPDAWHYRHFADPRRFFEKSNMPSYAWLKGRMIDSAEVRARMDTLGLPYTDDDIYVLQGKDEMDALVAYMQVLGTAVTKKPAKAPKAVLTEIERVNPLAGDPDAVAAGKELYEENCAMCHGEDGEGDIGPSLVDDIFLYEEGDLPDDDYFEIINNGTEEGDVEEGRTARGGMPEFSDMMGRDEIWSVITYIRSLKGK